MIDAHLSVCKMQDTSSVCWDGEYVFLSKAGGELSLVCGSADVPSDAIATEPGWRALRFEGTLDFSLVGVLAKATVVLAQAGISIFAISTYDTDYILLKSDKVQSATESLVAAGYEIV